MYLVISCRCIYLMFINKLCLRFHDGVVLMMPLCLEYHLLGFHQLPPKLNLTPRPSNIGKSNVFIVYMSSLKNILLDSIKKQAKKLKISVRNSWYHCYGDQKFTMPLLWWPKIGWEKFTVCSRGQILLGSTTKSLLRWHLR